MNRLTNFIDRITDLDNLFVTFSLFFLFTLTYGYAVSISLWFAIPAVAMAMLLGWGVDRLKIERDDTRKVNMLVVEALYRAEADLMQAEGELAVLKAGDRA